MATKTSAQTAAAARVISNMAKANAAPAPAPAPAPKPAAPAPAPSAPKSTWSAWDAAPATPSTPSNTSNQNSSTFVPPKPIVLQPNVSIGWWVQATDQNWKVVTSTNYTPATSYTNPTSWNVIYTSNSSSTNNGVTTTGNEVQTQPQPQAPQKTVQDFVVDNTQVQKPVDNTNEKTNQATKQLFDFTQAIKDLNTTYAQNQNKADVYLADQLKYLNTETAKQIDTINKSRMDSLNTSFANIEKNYSDLLEKSKSIYDVNQTIRESNRAKQLAAEWFINDAQAGQAAAFNLADYRRDADLKKSEIEQQALQMKTDLEKSKMQAIDALMKDTLTSELDKNELKKAIEYKYNEAANALTDRVTQFNNVYATTVSDAMSKLATADINNQYQTKDLLAQDQAQAALSTQQYQRALTDNLERQRLVLSKVPSELVPYVLEIMKADPQAYKRADIPNQIADYISRANRIRNSESLSLSKWNPV